MEITLAVIRGPIGAGKTTTMYKLREMWPGSSIIEIDNIKRMIDPSQSSAWRREVALRAGAFLAKELLYQGRNVIAEVHAHDMTQRDMFEDVAKQASAHFVSALLLPPLSACLSRAASREVPGITYAIDEAMVTQHYLDVVSDPGELVIDTASVDTEEAAKQILDVTALIQ